MLQLKELKLPEEIKSYYNLSEEELDQRVLFLLVSDLVRLGRINHKKAADILGIDVEEISDLVEQYCISPEDLNPDDFE